MKICLYGRLDPGRDPGNVPYGRLDPGRDPGNMPYVCKDPVRDPENMLRKILRQSMKLFAPIAVRTCNRNNYLEVRSSHLR